MSATPFERLTDEQRERILDVCAREEETSGRQPLGETARLVLATGEERPGLTHWLWHDPELQAYAVQLEAGDRSTVEMTASPDQPQSAHSLLSALQEELSGVDLWAHGDRSQTRLAAALVMLKVRRELLLMVRSLTDLSDPSPTPSDVVLRSFDGGRDSAAWLGLNAEAFAELPDQAGVTADELADKLAQPWSDPAGFLVAERDGQLAGFHWTKADPEAVVDGRASGEVYVLGVAPQEAGTGLAGALLDQGLARLREQGLRQVHLYVDADNSRAVRFYERGGFHLLDTDRQYSW